MECAEAPGSGARLRPACGGPRPRRAAVGGALPTCRPAKHL